MQFCLQLWANAGVEGLPSFDSVKFDGDGVLSVVILRSFERDRNCVKILMKILIGNGKFVPCRVDGETLSLAATFSYAVLSIQGMPCGLCSQAVGLYIMIKNRYSLSGSELFAPYAIGSSTFLHVSLVFSCSNIPLFPIVGC